MVPFIKKAMKAIYVSLLSDLFTAPVKILRETGYSPALCFGSYPVVFSES